MQLVIAFTVLNLDRIN